MFGWLFGDFCRGVRQRFACSGWRDRILGDEGDRRKLLVIDDHAENRAVILTLLELLELLGPDNSYLPWLMNRRLVRSFPVNRLL